MSYLKIKKIRISKYDKEWSLKVRARDERCLKCGRTQNLAAHHFVRRSVKSTRLMLENGITLCPSCHVFSHIFSAHRTPEMFKRWFKEKYPTRYKKVMAKEKVYMTELQAIKEWNELSLNQT